jgi:hypothetical protein
MRRTWIIAAVIALAIGGLAIVLRSGPPSDARGDCYNLGVGEVRSPDGAFGLATVVYTCEGQLDASVTNVTLLAFKDKDGAGSDAGVTSDGNVLGPVFAGDRDHGKAPAGPGSGPEVRVRWTAARKATIAYHHAAHVVSKTRALGGVELTFETFP